MRLSWNKILGIIILVCIALSYLLNKYFIDLLWFQAEGFAPVWWKTMVSQLVFKAIVFLLIAVLLLVNMFLTRENIITMIWEGYKPEEGLSVKNYLLDKILKSKSYKLLFIVFSAGLAVLFSVSTNLNWLDWQQLINKVSFDLNDPIFNKDISFFVFVLPLILKLLSLLQNSLTVILLICTAVYFLSAPILLLNFKHYTRAHRHLTFLGLTLLVLHGISLFFQRYLLLYSSRGVTFGASYTDIYAYLPGLYVSLAVTVLTCFIMIYSVYAKKIKVIFASLVFLLVISICSTVIYPGVIQKLQVEPNEYNKEAKFLKYNISYTLQAYNLEATEERDFNLNNKLTGNDLLNNQGTLNNIRLWDWRPIGQVYNQLQNLRPYYNFYDVDVDRYVVNGKTTQVIIGARELDQNKLSEQAQTWVNKKLYYTHGYGAVVSPVNEFTREGLPTFYLKDIPLLAHDPFNVTRPGIYFGEKTEDYVIVKTKTKEFDYPLGDNNADTYYEGSGGVQLGNRLSRLMFAIYFNDYKLLLTNDLTRESKILFNRQITERSKKVAPFLRYDQDPYLVIDEGKLYWIQDAYTTTNMYPYAEPYGGYGNYIRNSVKIVTDAYNGSMTFYLADTKDPIVQVYNNIFPGLFKPISEMPRGLQSHLRYPETLFKIQCAIYANYHMTNPLVFYNKEDSWSIPEEIIAGETKEMEPYYVVMQMPNSEEEEFILMQPFIAAKINKMVAWMAVRNDHDKYGKIVMYKFPKDKHIYGPLQIEARIDQDSEISQQLTLWNQRGSQVLRGNLLVIPINNSLLYIEPLYLQAEQSKIPELRRVIISFEDKVVMATTLQEALDLLFTKDQVGERNIAETGKSIADYIAEANQYFAEAVDKQKSGNWAGYGEALGKLQQTLEKLQESVNLHEAN